MRRYLEPLPQLLGPIVLVIAVGAVSTTASPANKIYFLSALVSVAPPM